MCLYIILICNIICNHQCPYVMCNPTAWLPIKLWLILSYLILSYLILSYLILSYLILSYLILSYLILSYLILSYLILSYLILSYLILSYCVWLRTRLPFFFFSYRHARYKPKPISIALYKLIATRRVHRHE